MGDIPSGELGEVGEGGLACGMDDDVETVIIGTPGLLSTGRVVGTGGITTVMDRRWGICVRAGFPSGGKGGKVTVVAPDSSISSSTAKYGSVRFSGADLERVGPEPSPPVISGEAGSGSW